MRPVNLITWDLVRPTIEPFLKIMKAQKGDVIRIERELNGEIINIKVRIR